MIEGIEALAALERTGTVSEAAVQLRLTQSAVSKRIHALQADLKYLVIEPDGRRVRLTARGLFFLERAKPLLAELKNLTNIDDQIEFSRFTIGLSDSIAASWGPELIRQITKPMSGLDFSIHVNRSVLVQENVKLGRYHFGLCTSTPDDKSLVTDLIMQEQMVVISCQLKDKIDSQKQMIIIEKGSSTWKSIKQQLITHPRLTNYKYLHVESFSAAIQMAKAGFGNAIVPKGLAETMGLPTNSVHLLIPSIKRDIRLISRKNISLLPIANKFKFLLKSGVLKITQNGALF